MRWRVLSTLPRLFFYHYCIPYSPVAFTQEGQLSEDMAALLASKGQNVALLLKIMASYLRYEFDTNPLPCYRLQGVGVVLYSKGVNGDVVEVGWSFIDDGELLATR